MTALATGFGVLDALPADAPGPRVWRALGRAGLIEQVYRDGSAAAGVDPERLGRLLAEVDERFAVGATLAVCVQLATVLPVLATGGGPAAPALRRALAGEAVVGLAATDAGTGSDLTALDTQVRLGGDELEVTGTKRWITNATAAEHFLVLARHRAGRHFTNFTWVLVPVSAPGVAVTPADTELFTGSGVGHVRFDRVRLPVDHVVGRPGRGLPSFGRHIGTERLAGALWAVALCRRTLAATLRRLSARPHGDGVLWDLDGIRHRFAACLVELRQLDALTRELGDRITSGHDSGAAALLKAAVGRAVPQVLGECAQLQGAEGFTAGGARTLGAQAGIFAVGGGVTEVVLGAVAGDAQAWLDELDPASRSWP
ncbi:acyl-CoA dehydrogenase [Labedaea rhizosphaerae]|uniref:acyl-CoA dehydrogenase n=1 Tax=Labedaea rhizosphaerae TaxID=598644 RepID=UPI001FB77CCF|nr:acyl-CoA dehydrogenase [Labedaea rhizosphaerae]